MGYTHYFRQKKNCPKPAFDKIVRDFKIVMENLPKHSLSAGGYYKDEPLSLKGPFGKGAPEVKEESISFNGNGENAHETMMIMRINADYNHASNMYVQTRKTVFQFCKTARKPYDLAVVALLLIMQRHAPDVWEISSDGTPEDWMEGQIFVHRLFPESLVSLPPGVSSR